MEDTVALWATVRQRQQACWRAFAWGPVVLVLALSIRQVPVCAVAVSLLWVGWLAARSMQLEASPCPRCGHLLFRDGAYHNSFVSGCLHCGQEIGAPVRAQEHLP